jgi:hypothetical protein
VEIFGVASPSHQRSDSDRAAFVQRLKYCAAKVGSVQKLARKARIHRNTIHGYCRENGQEPTRLKLVNLAVAAEVSVEWLVTGNEGRTSQPALEFLQIHAKLQEMAAPLRECLKVVDEIQHGITAGKFGGEHVPRK